MIVNAANLRSFFVNLRNDFTAGYGEAEPTAAMLATEIPSSSAFNKYGWLGQFPSVREWLGDKQFKNFTAHDYTLTNKDYEETIVVDRKDIEDDTFGMFSVTAKALGMACVAHKETLLYSLLQNGETTKCYDGSNFFDTTHPKNDGTTITNYTSGGGTGWYLLSLNRPLKPLIWQVRKPYEFKAMIQPDDEMVFMQRQYRYGVEARAVAGYGFWQFAYKSKATLDTNGFATGFQTLEAMQGDEGRPLGVKPTHLVVPPSLRSAAMNLINTERNASGASNIWYKSVDLIISSYLS